MSGMVACPTRDVGRYTLADISRTILQLPPDTFYDWEISTYLALARNKLVKRALDANADWIFFVDDDQGFPQDILLRLLAHEKPIVSGLYLNRNQPFFPIAFSHRLENGSYVPIDLTALPKDGLLQVRAVGAGCLLIRREVLEAIGDNWFQHGRVDDWDASEDIIFCEQARSHGYEVFVDLGCPIGHMAPTAISPQYIDNQWCLGFSVADGAQLYIPIEPTPGDPARYEEVAE
jgi:hypothetical protein